MIVCKYKFDKSIYSNLIPVFNDGYNGYTVSDVTEGNIVTRTIECNILPTLMRFGVTPINNNENVTNRELSLLEILDINTNEITTGYCMFFKCNNLSSINTENFNTSNITNMQSMFNGCNNLTSLDVSNFDTSKVTNTNYMFAYCNSLSTIDVSNFDTSNVTDMRNMFRNCSNLTSLDLSNFDTSKVTNMAYMFYVCNNLTSLDLSNFDTSNVSRMDYMFRDCANLTSLDVSNFDTSKVSRMDYMFYNCKLLASLDVSNWDTSNVIDMNCMFAECKSLTLLDVSNFNTNNVTNMEYMFNTPKLSDIGMLYCTPSTINKITSVLPTTHTQTVWVKDTDINKLTSVSGVEFKEYKENSYIINLSSPLLNGDRIEVVDGKLCHYHKMGMVVFDGSEEWNLIGSNTSNITTMCHSSLSNANLYSSFISDKYLVIIQKNGQIDFTKQYIIAGQTFSGSLSRLGIAILNSNLLTPNLNGFKQYLSENPTTIVYELANPYYEDITPLQSDIVLETYLECNMDIHTDLPIKTNVSYITNVPSLSTLSMRATEMKESDNIIANLTNMLDNEINE